MKLLIPKNASIFILFFLITFQTFAQHPSSGYASYYGKEFHGRRTASGEKYDMNLYTAAHKTLPFNTIIEIRHINSNKKVLVRVNDRGPFSSKRIIDISRAAAIELDLIREGVAMVEIKIINEDIDVDSLQTLNKDVAPTPIVIAEPPAAVIIAKPETKVAIKESTTKPNIWESVAENHLYNHSGTVAHLKGHGIQILSIGDTKKLASELDSLAKHGFENVYIEPAKIGAKKTYRILVGEYNTHKDAANDKLKLEQLGYNGFVRKYVK